MSVSTARVNMIISKDDNNNYTKGLKWTRHMGFSKIFFFFCKIHVCYIYIKQVTS